MTKEETRIKDKVYDRTVLYSGLCFDTTEEIHKAQDFICILIKKGVLVFPEDLPNDTGT